MLFVRELNNKATWTTISGSVVGQKGEDEHFLLCGRKFFLRDMPPPLRSPSEYSYGVSPWRRDPDNAVVLVHNASIPYGQTGNQIQEFFRAFDVARDRDGPLVIHNDGFPIDMTLRKLFLGIDNRTALEGRLGITFYDEKEFQEYKNGKVLSMDEAYHYVSSDKRFSLFDTMEHRHYIIQELYRMTSEEMESQPHSSFASEMCSSIYALFGGGHDGNGEENLKEKLGITKPLTKKYTVIHSRKDGFFGKKFLQRAHDVFGVDSEVGANYPPDLLKSILSPLGMINNTILIITDGKSPHVADALSSHPEIGPVFQQVPLQISTVTSDLTLAIFSDVFIGNPISTFSQYIVQVRYALGIGESYLFAKRNEETLKWETFCHDEHCFYNWMNIWAVQF